MRFERLGVFAYSQEEGTPAAQMPDQVPEEVKERRRDEIMQLQQQIAFEKAREQIGRRLSVMVEGYLPEDGVCVSRTYMDSPDVDGYLFFDSADNRMTGDIVPIRVTEASGYDLIGVAEEEDEEEAGSEE